jgi:hypothetical protein
VNTIAWAVRAEGPSELAVRFSGLRWKWIPYVPSGLQLAAAVQRAVAEDPDVQVLVLANHGLVVGANDCDSAEALLREVERRVAFRPRRGPEPDWALLARLALSPLSGGKWRVPPSIPIQNMGTDSVTRETVSGGVMYPCQAIFLTTRAVTLEPSVSPDELAALDEPFVMIRGAGTLVRKRPNPTESATLSGLALVLQRIPAEARLQYLNDEQVRGLLCADVYHYREVVEDNGAGHLTSVSNPALKSEVAAREVSVR